MIRALGIFLVLIGLLALGADLMVGFASDVGFEVHALGWWWAEIDRDSLLLLQPAVERYITPAIWDPGIQTLLEWPAAPQFIVIGCLFWVFGRWLRRGALG